MPFTPTEPAVPAHPSGIAHAVRYAKNAPPLVAILAIRTEEASPCTDFSIETRKWLNAKAEYVHRGYVDHDDISEIESVLSCHSNVQARLLVHAILQGLKRRVESRGATGGLKPG